MITLAELVFSSTQKKVAPGPKGNFFLGTLPGVRKDPLGFLVNNAREFGDVVRFSFGPMCAHLIASPAGVQHVLVEGQKNYGKQTRGFKNLRYVLGNGLLTAEGDEWRKNRRIAQPAFHKQRIASFAQTMVKAAEDTARRLNEKRGQIVDLSMEMGRLTIRIVGETLFSYDPSNEADQVGRALAFLLRMANERTSRIVDIPATWPTPENNAFRKALRVLDGVMQRIIAERRKNPGDRGDLLSMLIESRDAETGENLSDQQLRDEAMTIFLAGHETTAMALTFTFLCLSKSPPVERELRAELAEALGDRAPTLDDLPKLKLNKMVLQEAMRLYPPAWLVARSASVNDEIDGYDIPRGSIVFVSPYVTQRHPRLWENPEGFDPRRFEREPAKGTYFPFGGGPRMCIGNVFAMMEAELALATILPRVKLELVPGTSLALEPSITLRPLHGLQMRVK